MVSAYVNINNHCRILKLYPNLICRLQPTGVIRHSSDVNSITKIANDGIGFMKGYKNKLKDGEDKVLAQWIIQNAEKGWE